MKRKHLIIISSALLVCTALYAAAGFLLAPALLKSNIQAYVAETTGRSLQIERLAINPFTLEAEINNLDLRDQDNTLLLGIDRLYGNFNGPALITGVFEIEELVFEQPRGELILFAGNETNLARFLADLQGTEKNDGGVPPVRIIQLDLSHGELDIVRKATGPASGITLTDIGLQASEVGTDPETSGMFELRLHIPGGGRASLAGEIQPLGLTSSGQLAFTDIDLSTISEWLPQLPGTDDINAFVNLDSTYELSFSHGASRLELLQTRLEVSDLHVILEDEAGSVAVETIAAGLAVSASRNGNDLQALLELEALRFSSVEYGIPEHATPLLFLDEVVLGGAEIDLVSRQAHLARFSIDGGSVRIDPDTALPGGQFPAMGGEADSSAGPFGGWNVSLDRLETSELDIALTTMVGETRASMELDTVTLAIHDLSTAPDSKSEFTLNARAGASGTLQADGWLAATPPAIQAAIDLDSFELVTLDPVLQTLTGLKLKNGRFSTRLDLRYQQGETVLNGKITASDIELVDRSSGERIIAMDEILGSDLHIGESVSSLALEKIRLDNPYLNLVINADRSINLASLFRTAEPKIDDIESASALPRLRIEQVEINNGRLDFTDLSLSPNFRITSQDMNGTVTGLHLEHGRTALLKLEGRIDEYGSSAITGHLQPLAPLRQSEISMELRNIATSIMSPYAAKFAGRKIESGKLNLKLDYLINDGKVDGSNDIELVDFVLGERTESPDAVDLPLDLAIALFRDGDGRIRLAVPVTGDLENPKFNVRSVIARAVQQTLVKAAAAPFKLLGSLLGGDAPKQLDSVPFEAGKTELTPPAMEVITAVSEILHRRPALALVSVGTYDPIADRDALARQQVRLHLSLATVEGPTSTGAPKPINFSDPLVQDVLDEFGKSRLGDDVISGIGVRNSPEASEADQETGRRTYYQALFNALVDNEEVSEFAIKNLAKYRAQSIVDELQRQGIQAARIRAADKLQKADSVDNRVAARLEMQVAE